jgi:hypothetical protein
VRFSAIAAACLCLAAPAPGAAQEVEEAFDAPDAATARARADEALARSGGEAVWENVTTTTTPELRHRQSGGVCRFWAESVYPGADRTSYGTPVEAGSEVTCSTSVRLRGDRMWAFGTYIEAAGQGLDGAGRYRYWDGELTPDLVTPAYRARRMLRWGAFVGGPIAHEAVRMLRGPDGRELPVYGMHAMMADRATLKRILTVLVNGWLVTQETSAPAEEDAAAEAMAVAALQRLVSGMTRPHPDAAAMTARVARLLRDEAAPPPNLDDATADRIESAFSALCILAPAAGRSFESAVAQQPGWTPVPPPPPPGLPNVMNDPAPRVWRVPGGGGQVYLHLNAAMNGDCAVSAYGVDAARLGPILRYRLTRGPAARLVPGWRSALAPGIESVDFDGRGWPAEGAMITNATGDAGRPALFIGVRTPRPPPAATRP